MGIQFTAFTLIGKEPFTTLKFLALDGNGQFSTASLSDGQTERAISGKYDAGSGELNFNDSVIPGNRIGTTFFDGSAIANADGTVKALHGTWTEVVYTKSNEPPPSGKIGTIVVSRLQGEWVAINPEQIIG